MNWVRVLCLPFIFLLLSGCTTYKLDKKWLPLRQLKDRIGPSDFIITLGDTVYISDLDEFLERNPDGSVDFNAMMCHERLHSYRQLSDNRWFLKYALSREFRTHEEKLGWYVQIRVYLRAGVLNKDRFIRQVKDATSAYWLSLGPRKELNLWIEHTILGVQWVEEHKKLLSFIAMKSLPE